MNMRLLSQVEELSFLPLYLKPGVMWKVKSEHGFCIH